MLGASWLFADLCKVGVLQFWKVDFCTCGGVLHGAVLLICCGSKGKGRDLGHSVELVGNGGGGPAWLHNGIATNYLDRECRHGSCGY